jgi:hypothetical protein
MLNLTAISGKRHWALRNDHFEPPNQEMIFHDLMQLAVEDRCKGQVLKVVAIPNWM